MIQQQQDDRTTYKAQLQHRVGNRSRTEEVSTYSQGSSRLRTVGGKWGRGASISTRVTSSGMIVCITKVRRPGCPWTVQYRNTACTNKFIHDKGTP